jgi:3-methyladenine DNA glycosylase AlkC
MAKLKDLFTRESVAALASAVGSQVPAFQQETFLERVFDDGWDGLELKQRTRHITTVLHELLALEYRPALSVLRGALPRVGDDWTILWIFPDYVEVYGLEDWEASMPALETFTQRMSAEFAIRPFIVRHPERTMTRMLAWTQHESVEVRRLATEGCRPRLPWGIRLPDLVADPSPILPILEQLKNDGAETVRRSVANNLNDISKDNPRVVLDTLRRWQVPDGEPSQPEIDWITRHALRTLIKKGDPQALELLGYSSNPAIAVRSVTVEPEVVAVGDKVTFSFDIESLADEPQKLMIDYVVYHMRANGRLTPKVFKLSKSSIGPGEILRVRREHSFRPVSTRRYYPGDHAIEPKINGRQYDRVEFILKALAPN